VAEVGIWREPRRFLYHELTRCNG